MFRYLKLIILIAIVSVLVVKSGVYKDFLGARTAYAVGDLIVNWGVPSGQPIFTLSNMAPGHVESHTVSVTNGSTTTRTIGVNGIKTQETGNLGNALTMTISRNGTDVYGGTTGEKTLTQFFADSALPNFLALGTQGSGQTANYLFTVRFKPEAGNEYQNRILKMDLIIGLALDVPAACQGITFDGKVITGTQKADSLNGTNKNDLIIGLEGNDAIAGGNGNDCIVGGAGNDAISGDNGDDVIDAGEGNDSIAAGNGNDTVLAGGGNDSVDVANGDDSITGGTGNDNMTGGNGNDALTGEAGTDTAVGGTGTDTCSAETRVSCEL